MCSFNDNCIQQLRTHSQAGVCLINEGQQLDGTDASPLSRAAVRVCDMEHGKALEKSSPRNIQTMVTEYAQTKKKKRYKIKKKNKTTFSITSMSREMAL